MHQHCYSAHTHTELPPHQAKAQPWTLHVWPVVRLHNTTGALWRTRTEVSTCYYTMHFKELRKRRSLLTEEGALQRCRSQYCHTLDQLYTHTAPKISHCVYTSTCSHSNVSPSPSSHPLQYTTGARTTQCMWIQFVEMKHSSWTVCHTRVCLTKTTAAAHAQLCESCWLFHCDPDNKNSWRLRI